MDLQLAAPARSTPTGTTYLPALDGLRGVAILGVLLFHTGHLTGGFLGVDLFFVLSGYLITGLLLREVERTGSVSLRAFWGRRVRRLLPALATVLVTVTVLVWATAPPDLVRTTLGDGPWVQANLMNWHLLAESASYWGRFGSERVFEHLWSIAVEEQFYLVWPVVVVALSRLPGRTERSVAGVAAVGSVASLVAMVALHDLADPTRVYLGTDTRAFSLLLGALVAVEPIRRGLVRLVGRWARIVVTVLLVGVLALWVVAEGEGSTWLFRGGILGHSAASAVLIALCADASGGRAQRLPGKALAWGPLRGLGRISYSLYLWHWPVIVLLSTEVTGLVGWPLTALVCSVSTALAVLSTRLVEDPIRYRAQWATGRSGVLATVLVTATVAALWFLLPGPALTEIDLTRLG